MLKQTSKKSLPRASWKQEETICERKLSDLFQRQKGIEMPTIGQEGLTMKKAVAHTLPWQKGNNRERYTACLPEKEMKDPKTSVSKGRGAFQKQRRRKQPDTYGIYKSD